MEIHHPDKEIYNDLFVLDWMCTNVCLCVLVHVNKTVYLLPMKGMFAWTNPQLIFLFELLQAHCTNLKEIGGVRRCFLYKAMHHL